MEDLPQAFNFDGFIFKYRYYFLIILVGLILVGAGFLFAKKSLNFSSSKVEVLGSSGGEEGGTEITAEISGSVMNPAVYKFQNGARIDDLLIAAGGLTAAADRVWTDKYLNRAAKLSDGQKVYIPSVDEHSESQSAKNSGVYQSGSSTFSSDSNKMVNINTATIGELDSLPGIGPTYGQKIIEHRPYSKIEEVVTSGAITQTIYEKIKNNITIY